MKKISNIIMILLLFALTFNIANADNNDLANLPSKKDTTYINIKGIEENCTVKGYKVIEATYETYGLTGFKQVDITKEYTDFDLTTTMNGNVVSYNKIPSYENINNIVVAIRNKSNNLTQNIETIEFNYDSNKKMYYTNNATAGSYIVLIESENGNEWKQAGESANVYNPLFLSINYENSGNNTSIEGNEFSVNNDIVSLLGVQAYAKKSQPVFDKVIIDSSTGNNKVDDTRIGDTVKFNITSVVPDYSDGYDTDKLIYKIVDTQSDGLKIVDIKNIHIYLGDIESNIEIEKSNYNIIISDPSVIETSNNFSVSFKGEWVKNNPYQIINIVYSTEVTDDAVVACNSNPNNAELLYSTSITNYEECAKITAKTRHYTFMLNIKKVDEYDQAVSGAEFELSQLSENNINGNKNIGDVKYIVESDKDGLINFNGLEEGTYLLKETKAPKGYTLNDSTWKIVISPEYNNDKNIINQYTVSITENYKNGLNGNTINYSYIVDEHKDSDDGLYDIVTIKSDASPSNILFNIVNTKLSKLPSVGGNGTYILVLLGVLISCVTLLISTNSKKNDK